MVITPPETAHQIAGDVHNVPTDLYDIPTDLYDVPTDYAPWDGGRGAFIDVQNEQLLDETDELYDELYDELVGDESDLPEKKNLHDELYDELLDESDIPENRKTELRRQYLKMSEQQKKEARLRLLDLLLADQSPILEKETSPQIEKFSDKVLRHRAGKEKPISADEVKILEKKLTKEITKATNEKKTKAANKDRAPGRLPPHSERKRRPHRNPAHPIQPQRVPTPAYQPQQAPAPVYQPQRAPAPAYQPQRAPAPAYQPQRAPPAYQPQRAPPSDHTVEPRPKAAKRKGEDEDVQRESKRTQTAVEIAVAEVLESATEKIALLGKRKIRTKEQSNKKTHFGEEEEPTVEEVIAEEEEVIAEALEQITEIENAAANAEMKGNVNAAHVQSVRERFKSRRDREAEKKTKEATEAKKIKESERVEREKKLREDLVTKKRQQSDLDEKLRQEEENVRRRYFEAEEQMRKQVEEDVKFQKKVKTAVGNLRHEENLIRMEQQRELIEELRDRLLQLGKRRRHISENIDSNKRSRFAEEEQNDGNVAMEDIYQAPPEEVIGQNPIIVARPRRITADQRAIAEANARNPLLPAQRRRIQNKEPGNVKPYNARLGGGGFVTSKKHLTGAALRFAIIKGEVEAGNNNPVVLKLYHQLRKFFHN